MNISNLEMTQATIEIFGGFICLMLNVIILMNGSNSELTFDAMRELSDKLMYEEKEKYYIKTGKKRRQI